MGLAVGIDIGGTKIAGGVVDDDGNILQMDRRSTRVAARMRSEKVVIDPVNEYKAEFGVESVGIGLLDSSTRSVPESSSPQPRLDR